MIDGVRLPRVVVNCPQCGEYFLSTDTLTPSEIEKVNIAGYLYETKSVRGESSFEIDNTRLSEILKSPLVPRTLSDRISKVVTYIDSESRYFGQSVTPPIPVMYVADKEERANFLRSLMNEHLINLSGNVEDKPEVSLTLKALDFIKPRIETSRPGQCFVAMWFDEKMNKFFNEIVLAGCANAGYKAIRVIDKEYNGDITDEIIAGIKESDFIIADFTGQRGGVYYEAGYAIGLGKTVIQMCQEEDLPNMHFDTNHINTIKWNYNDVDSYRKILTNRIRATIGLGPNISKS
nr:hypothetical protein [uncultured Sphaerochaeta sp.]